MAGFFTSLADYNERKKQVDADLASQNKDSMQMSDKAMAGIGKVGELISQNNSSGQDQGTSAVGGALQGAAAGAALGPYGAAIGGVVGGVSGLLSASASKRAAKKAKEERERQEYNQRQQQYADLEQDYGNQISSILSNTASRMRIS